MAQTTNAINGVKYNYKKEEKKLTKVSFSNGVVLDLEGSNSVATVTAALKKYLENTANLPLTTTPAYPNPMPSTGTKPTFSLPEGNYIEISLTSGKTLDLSNYSNQKIKLKPGNYNSVYITGNKLKNIIIDANGVNLEKSVIELGSGDMVEIYGIKMYNNDSRVLRFDFGLNNFHLYNSTFINCGDYAFYCNRAKEVDYNGKDATANLGLKIINNVFDNFGNIQMEGKLDKDINADRGLFKNPEIAFNTFKNNPSIGSAVVFENVENYDIHHNIVENLNSKNDNHNGIFYMQGSGKFHDNKLNNYQGNAIRMWLYTRGSTPYTNEIFNNFCFNTRKYGGFELQGFDRYIIPGKTTFANAKVYNNTVGRMNTSKDWEGQMLDLYNYGGTLEYYNNLGFELNYSGRAIGNMINNMSDVKISGAGNIYKLNIGDALDSEFNSKFPGIGARQ
ncbi:hypothetical protein [Pedobacter sp. Leaf132]|uniref:hypothetical protein n=1 Tax=Pedobacter sp. Leaf132 TaxID=2876557 RepID=UPI001E58ACB3|nr:hypothetical protein [Pedobacter sp. Leaf132]